MDPVHRPRHVGGWSALHFLDGRAALAREISGYSFQLDFHEPKLIVVDIDDVVGDAGQASI
jgi:hypothetical protein